MGKPDQPPQTLEKVRPSSQPVQRPRTMQPAPQSSFVSSIPRVTAATPVRVKQMQKVRSDDALQRTISPIRRAPQQRPILDEPLEPAPSPEDVPLLSSPKLLAKLLAKGSGEERPGQRFRMPELPDANSSGDETSGVHSGYWNGLPDDLESSHSW